MDYTLMHKNIPVVDMEILTDTGHIVRLFNLRAPEHLPLGVNSKNGLSRKVMDDWWTGRSIPASRDGLFWALESIGVSTATLLIEKSCGLSLSDQYWISPKGSGLKWETVNFFQNDFSKDMGEILFGRDPDGTADSGAYAGPARLNLVSPDNTSDGWLRKKWIIADGRRCLMKGGSGDYRQEPLNEVISSAICRRLNIPHAAYTLTYDNGRLYSLCEDFITPDTELITAQRVREAVKKDNRDSDFVHLLRCCETLGIPGVRAGMEKMLALDYIISNEDRHYNNFGFVRDAQTLEWFGLAPIFDSGTSLWYNTRFVGRETECKPFKKTHAEQIKLVSDWTWFDYAALEGLVGECAEILSHSNDIDAGRSDSIAAAITKRCEQVQRLGIS